MLCKLRLKYVKPRPVVGAPESYRIFMEDLRKKAEKYSVSTEMPHLVSSLPSCTVLDEESLLMSTACKQMVSIPNLVKSSKWRSEQELRLFWSEEKTDLMYRMLRWTIWSE